MGKSKSASKNRKSSLPSSPWLFINDATSDDTFGDAIVANLVSLIPKAGIAVQASPGHPLYDANWEPGTTNDTVLVFLRRQLDASNAVVTSNHRREKAIELGRNYASVSLTKDSSVAAHGSKVDWGTNHLEVNTTHLVARQAAEKIFKWLCKLCGSSLLPSLNFSPRLTTVSCSQSSYCPRDTPPDPRSRHAGR
jgi:hypothetical protein